MNIQLDARWSGDHGIGRFSSEIQARLMLPEVKLPLVPVHPASFIMSSLWLLTHPRSVLFSPGYNAPVWGLSRYAFVVHDLNHIDIPFNSSPLKRLHYELILKRACLNAACLMTVSEFTARRLSEWSGVAEEKISIVGNGVSRCFTEQGPRREERRPYYLVVGNRKGHKNESAVVRAFAALGADCDTSMIFTGEPSEPTTALIEELGIKARTEFVGRVSESSLAALYRGALALVFPSLYEGFGLPVIEAMACGTPVITSTTTSLPEVAGDAALLVEPTAVSDIRDAMRRLYDAPALRAELRQRGLVRCQEFSWDEVANRVRAALERVAH